ncbi:MAG TPA: glycosyltransferase family 2 protein [Solirubrobacterales bacterium]|jgi:glycosyltransferase involved in cell wall biosynthesis|nr:glycosyltransferase family 2 protein [Solirubrobacterales bacterium]
MVVDVVITNHNYGRFLLDAVKSARAQTHSRVNVIVVDDGSTDGSRELLAGLGDGVEVVLKERGGQASALNAGIARCAGDVLLLLDADDVLRPEAAARVAETFAADPDLVKVQFRMAVVDAAGRPTGATKPSGHLQPPIGDVRRAELAFPFDLAWLPGGGTAFRTSSLRELLPIPEADYPHFGADWYLVHLGALAGSSAALDEICAEYRIHGGNGYELDRPSLDLDHIRDAIVYASATCRSLERRADAIGLRRPDPILSLSDLANRLISLRLAPGLHPVSADTRAGLVVSSMRAARRRFDVSWPMKGMFVAWFAAEAAAPRPLARKLAELFLFPERRRAFNRLLGRLQRSEGGARIARLG